MSGFIRSGSVLHKNGTRSVSPCWTEVYFCRTEVWCDVYSHSFLHCSKFTFLSSLFTFLCSLSMFLSKVHIFVFIVPVPVLTIKRSHSCVHCPCSCAHCGKFTFLCSLLTVERSHSCVHCPHSCVHCPCSCAHCEKFTFLCSMFMFPCLLLKVHIPVFITCHSQKAVKLHHVSEKYLRTVSVHPTNSNFFCTASTDMWVQLNCPVKLSC